jgi:hypothetical protein
MMILEYIQSKNNRERGALPPPTPQGSKPVIPKKPRGK